MGTARYEMGYILYPRATTSDSKIVRCAAVNSRTRALDEEIRSDTANFSEWRGLTIS
jgi:hypothetical protein